MPITKQVDEIVKKVETRLSKEEVNGVYLKVTNHSLDDGWLYIEVDPSWAGVRALDHSRLVSQIERELRANGDQQVLLVPALED